MTLFLIIELEIMSIIIVYKRYLIEIIFNTLTNLLPKTVVVLSSNWKGNFTCENFWKCYDGLKIANMAKFGHLTREICRFIDA